MVEGKYIAIQHFQNTNVGGKIYCDASTFKIQMLEGKYTAMQVFSQEYFNRYKLFTKYLHEQQKKKYSQRANIHHNTVVANR